MRTPGGHLGSRKSRGRRGCKGRAFTNLLQPRAAQSLTDPLQADR